MNSLCPQAFSIEYSWNSQFTSQGPAWRLKYLELTKYLIQGSVRRLSSLSVGLENTAPFLAKAILSRLPAWLQRLFQIAFYFLINENPDFPCCCWCDFWRKYIAFRRTSTLGTWCGFGWLPFWMTYCFVDMHDVCGRGGANATQTCWDQRATF